MNYVLETEPSAEPGRFGDVGNNIPVKLTKEELKELSSVNSTLACLHVAAEWGLVVATIYLCQRFWHPMLYVFAVAFIGSRQHALVVLMHDGVHYRLLRNRWLNDWMSEVILAWPHLVSARQYRKNHFAHHKYLNTAQDPDLNRRKGDPAWVFPQAVPELARTLFRDVTGLNAPAMLKLAASVASADKVPTGFLVARYGFYAAVLGVVAYFGALEAFALYWIVPMFTWLVLIMRIRSIAEHHAIDEPQSRIPEDPDHARKSARADSAGAEERQLSHRASLFSERALLPAARAACAVNVEAGVPRRRPHDTHLLGCARGIGGPQTVAPG